MAFAKGHNRVRVNLAQPRVGPLQGAMPGPQETPREWLQRRLGNEPWTFDKARMTLVGTWGELKESEIYQAEQLKGQLWSEAVKRILDWEVKR